MAGRLIDVLGSDERELQSQVMALEARVVAMNEELRYAEGRKSEVHAVVTKLKEEAEELQVQAAVRGDAEAAKQAYSVQKPERFDVVVYRLRPPKHGRTEKTTVGFVKMWWGNRSKIIYEGAPAMAEVIGQKVVDLTSQRALRVTDIDTKQALFKD